MRWASSSLRACFGAGLMPMPTTTTSLAATAAWTSVTRSRWRLAMNSRIAGWIRVSSRIWRGNSASDRTRNGDSNRTVSGRRAFHRCFGNQALDVAIDRGDREHPPLVLVAHHAVARSDVALDRQFVPTLGVADVVDRYVVVLAPEERHGIESLPRAEHVERGNLPLALRHHPVFDPDRGTTVPVRPARDVAGGEHGGRVGFQVLVDRNAAVERQAGTFGQAEARSHANTCDYQVGVDRAAAF